MHNLSLINGFVTYPGLVSSSKLFSDLSLVTISLHSRPGACNFQGGAIQATNGANVEIYTSKFQSNTASDYVSNSEAVFEKLPYFLLQFLAGHMELFVIERRPVGFAPIVTNLGAKEWGKCQLPFALLFSSIRAFSVKRTISNFRSNSRRATCIYRSTTAAPSTVLVLRRNLVQMVRLVVSFNFHYFSSPPDHLLPKELSKNFAPIPGGELLGWSNLCE
jgi:hypothetical protein